MNKSVIIYEGHTRRKQHVAKTLRQSMTLAEKTIWGFLKTNRLIGFHFRRQHIIEGFIVDFYSRSAGFIIEIEDPIHERRKKQDAKREQVLKACGLRILRFSSDRVRYDLFNVLEEILAAT